MTTLAIRQTLRLLGGAAVVVMAVAACAPAEDSAVEATQASNTANMTTPAEPAASTPSSSTEPQRSATSASGPPLTLVDPAAFAYPRNENIYTWDYSTGGPATGLCVASDISVTCTGSPASSVPDLTDYFPGRPGAVEAGPAGIRYTFLEGIPPSPRRLEAGQVVEIGAVRCAMPDAATLSCSTGGGSFTVRGPHQDIATTGTVLAENDPSNSRRPTGLAPSEPRSKGSAGPEQPRDYMGATGLVSGVRTASGRLVTASVPACDGRGILILASYVEAPNPQQGIAELLDRFPGAEFATPGQCPSLRASVDGARVYPIYMDYGGDTAALCREAASQGGTARHLSATPEFASPC